MGVIGNPTPQDGEDLPEEFVGYGNQSHLLGFPPGEQAFIEHPALLVEPGSTEGGKKEELPQEGIPPSSSRPVPSSSRIGLSGGKTEEACEFLTPCKAGEGREDAQNGTGQPLPHPGNTQEELVRSWGILEGQVFSFLL